MQLKKLVELTLFMILASARPKNNLLAKKKTQTNFLFIDLGFLGLVLLIAHLVKLDNIKLRFTGCYKIDRCFICLTRQGKAYQYRAFLIFNAVLGGCKSATHLYPRLWL